MSYQVKGEILPSDSGAQSFVQRLPMGVVYVLSLIIRKATYSYPLSFVISPWNAPLGLSLMTVLPPIAAGNTVVLKTSEYSPAGQLIAAELLKEVWSLGFHYFCTH